jgi:hypothetical protein
VLLSAKMIEKWLVDLHTECTRDAQHGHPTGLLKAVDGPVSRSKFKDKTAVHTILKPLIGEARFENRLIAPESSEDLQPISRGHGKARRVDRAWGVVPNSRALGRCSTGN